MGLQSESANIIKRSVSMEDVCEYYGIHFKRGYAPCPIHKEKTGSMKINPRTQKVHCFGCGWTGDMFDLVGWLCGLNTVESIKKIATDFNIRIPLTDSFTPLERSQMQREADTKRFKQAQIQAEIEFQTDLLNDAIAEYAYMDRALNQFGDVEEFKGVRFRKQLAEYKIGKLETKLNELKGGDVDG